MRKEIGAIQNGPHQVMRAKNTASKYGTSFAVL